jgi:ankyrin repeat protein
VKALEEAEEAKFAALERERRASTQARLDALERAEEERIAALAKDRRASTQSRLEALEQEELEAKAKLEAAAEADRLATATKLREVEAANEALQRRFEELERERAKREAAVASAEQRQATKAIGANKSLVDVLFEEKKGGEADDDDDDDEEEELAAHQAAAAGDARALRDLDDAALAVTDSAHRTALFYACAHDRPACVEEMARRLPHLCDGADANGDTALHAAVSAGAAECARALLKKGSAMLVRTGNGVGMHPCHLAANVSCLEVLLEHGATFHAVDAQSRTPLFVACAMNRFECATFLLEVLELEGGDSTEQADARGDTPLHAAACNGAEACVRMLLENGVRCDVTNARGLRALDLANRGGHAACAKLLGEYNLHMSTNFDSVLFLATVEGHRQCKRLLDEAQRHRRGPAYEILKKQADGLSRTASRYSLKRGASMKLAQWGQWIAYEDAELQTVFWYNQASGEGTWDKPSAVEEAMALAKHEDQNAWEALRHNSMRLAMVGDTWLQYRENGCDRTFYYNPATGDFQWDRPKDVADHLESIKQVSTAREEGDDDRPPGPWVAYTDDNTGATYWHNEATGVSQWERPDDIGCDGAPAQVVSDLDDLGI